LLLSIKDVRSDGGKGVNQKWMTIHHNDSDIVQLFKYFSFWILVEKRLSIKSQHVFIYTAIFDITYSGLAIIRIIHFRMSKSDCISLLRYIQLTYGFKNTMTNKIVRQTMQSQFAYALYATVLYSIEMSYSIDQVIIM